MTAMAKAIARPSWTRRLC